MCRKIKSEILIKLLDRLYLGHEVQKLGQEHLIPCPFCTSDTKCSINVYIGVFLCWSCGEHGHVSKFLTQLHISGEITRKDKDAVLGKPGALGLSSKIQVVKKKKPKHQDRNWTESNPCVFPDCVFPLSEGKPLQCESRLWKRAFSYLRFRGFDELDVEKYDIHFCGDISSRYYGHLVFPILDWYGKDLQYWTTRTIIRDNVPKSLHASGKYSKFTSANILFNIHKVSPGHPVAITEGPFDAMSVTKHVMPAVALLGKVLHPRHVNLLSKAKPSEVVVCLDPEALSEARGVAQALQSLECTVKVLNLASGDPNDIPAESLIRKFKEIESSPGLGATENSPDLPPREYWAPRR